MINTICNILEFLTFTLIACTLLGYKFKTNKYLSLIILYILPDIVCHIFSINLASDADFIFCVVLLLFYIKFYFHIELITSLCTYATAYFTIFLLQLVLMFINAFVFKIDNPAILALIGSIYTLITSLLIYRYANLNKLFTLLFETGKAGKFIIANLYILATIIVLYFHANLTTYYENILFIIVAFVIIIICNMLLSNQLGKIKEQKLRLSSYEEYLPMLEDLIHTVRIRQHNYNNQLQAIAGLLYTHKDYASLSSALEEQFKLATNSNVPEYLLKINLPVVAGFLYQKANEAKKHDKTIEYDFNTYTLFSKIPEYDLIEMFGILIDNAVEAICSGSTVYVNVDCDGEHITFTTRNSGYILTPDDRKRFFSKGYSNKKDNKPHSGLGLYQLNKLIKQYTGSSVSLWNEDSDILFQIIV